jgi:pyridoxamine 5'-phosphate oxidase-like protein
VDEEESVESRNRELPEDGAMSTRKTRSRARKPKSSRPHMLGYGLPEGDKGLLPWRWAERRLKKSHNYWITTVKLDRASPETSRASSHASPHASPHTMVVWGLWQDGCFLFSTGSKSRKARNLAENSDCVVCTENAAEAVIVEGVAEIADMAARRKMLPVYERKYNFDMGAMKKGILSMKEPVFAVRPRVAFGLWEKHFVGKSTRWTFD